VWETSSVGPFDAWPTGGGGFEYFYGFIGGEANQWYPSLYEGTNPVEPKKTPEEGYHLMEDMTEKAMSWIGQQKALAPDKPFFAYFAPGATHAPHHVPKEWADKYKGKFDQGWDKYREEILARQKKLGIVPENTRLTAKAAVAPDWTTLTADEKKVAIRYQELFAAFAELTDVEIGRVVQAIEDVGVLDNTVIIYVTGDNGASPNGGRLGVFNTMSTFNQSPETLQYQLETLDEVGGPHSAMTPPAGWSFGDNTPFAYSQLHTQLGGTTNGAIVSWPKGIKAKGEIRRQYHHLIDIAPTVLAAAGLPQPKTVNGVAQKPIEGVNMMYSFDNAQATSARTTQYYEIYGNRGIYKDGWYATTLHKVAWEAKPRTASYADDKWDLCNVADDYSCSSDVSAQHPDKLKELQAAFMEEAIKYNVLPLDDRAQERFNATLAGRPEYMGGRTSLTLYPGMIGMKENAFIDVKNRSSSITAELESGGAGVIVAQGGAHSGWSLYVKDGRPAFAYNFLGAVTTISSSERLPAGAVTVTYEFAYDGGGKPGAGGTGTLSINGKKVGSGRLARTIPFIYGVETADVGIDLYSAVTTAYATGENQFSGKIKQVVISVKSDAAKPDAGVIRHIPE
jgi:arylsulfatase